MLKADARMKKSAWIVLPLGAALVEAQSLCRTSTTINVPPVTRILQAGSTCVAGNAATTITGPYTTIYQTVYLEFCPTGLQPKTYTITETCDGSEPTPHPTDHVPQGFTTTVSECHKCGATPITATLTIPCGECRGQDGHPPPGKTPSPADKQPPGSKPEDGHGQQGNNNPGPKPEGDNSGPKMDDHGKPCDDEHCQQGDHPPNEHSGPSHGDDEHQGAHPDVPPPKQGPQQTGATDNNGGDAHQAPPGMASQLPSATKCEAGKQCADGTATKTGGPARYTGSAPLVQHVGSATILLLVLTNALLLGQL